MARKGFPESYDRRALLRFVSEVKAGAAEVRAPFYSHLAYDIVPDAQVTVRRPDVLIIEGLNVLQPPGPGPSARGQRPVRLHDLRRRAHERHRPVVRGAVPEAAARGVLEPALLLPPLREPHRGRGPPAGARDLALDQRAEPAAEHPPDAGRARRWCCARAPTTRCRACCCESSEARAVPTRAGAGASMRRPLRAIGQFVRRTRTTSASAAACRSAASCSAASTITRTIGSVPDGRSSTRPESPSSASTAATAAAISASSCERVVVDARAR